MNLLKALFTFLLIFTLSSAVNSQTKDFLDIQKLEAYLNIIHLKKGFNGEVLVAKNSNVLFQKTIGLASYEHNSELKENTKYRIASITKTFTATLILIAEEEGKLNIEDKAADHLRGLSTKFNHITISYLLSHTSGLPHNEGIKDYWLIKSKQQMSPKKILEEINTLDLLYEPGSQMKYSSLGYYLLASILENVYKDSFENILKAKILNKLQMTETGIVDNLKIIPKMTSGYHLVTDDSLVVAPYRNYSMLKGAGDMYSNSKDLLKWNNSFFSNTLFNQESELKIFDKQSRTLESNKEVYSNGWYVRFDKPRKQFHGGGTWGFSSHNTIYLDNKMSIIILSNVSTLPISSIASDIEKIVFDQPFQMPSIEEEIFQNALDFGKYCGKFISDSNKMTLTISEIKNSLYAQLAGNPPFEIYPKGNHQFFGKKIEIEITFEMNNERAIGLKAERMGKSFHFKKEDS